MSTPEDRWAEFEAYERQVDRRIEEAERRSEEAERDPAVQRGRIAQGLEIVIDNTLEPVAAAIADTITPSIKGLAEKLAELGLIDENKLGTARYNVDLDGSTIVDGIEVEKPEPRLYSLYGADTIVATRMRSDGRLEHAVLDEDGLPIEWRTADNPKLN
jgi:hypothetical protein